VTRNRRAFGLLRRIAASLLCILLAILFYRNYRALNPPDLAWMRVQDNGLLRVGMDTSYPPFSALVDGAPVGLDVDLALEIARRLDVRMQIVPLGIDGLYDALITGHVDALITALVFDPARLGDVRYTRPYLDAGQVIVSHGGLSDMESLEGMTVAVEYGSAGDELARRWTRRLSALTVARHMEPDAALEAVIRGEADAALVDHVSARLFRRAHPDSGLVIAPDSALPDPYVIAVALPGRVLVAALDAALAAMESDGTLAALIARWL
jgi:polar amino acid transport system substrate-binding protein